MIKELLVRQITFPSHDSQFPSYVCLVIPVQYITAVDFPSSPYEKVESKEWKMNKSHRLENFEVFWVYEGLFLIKNENSSIFFLCLVTQISEKVIFKS